MSTTDLTPNPNQYEDLKLLEDETKTTFLWIYIILTIFSVCGNCAVIYCMTRRKYRIFQKTCIISLAASDLLGTVAIATTGLVNFSQDVMRWPLGKFLCQFLPMCQNAGILASSVALVVIAMDRYRNVIFALSRRWNPRPSLCLLVAAAVWLCCFLLSYPMYTYYSRVFYPISNDDDIPCCIMKADKNEFRNYNITMVIIIFLPLFSVFLWFYYSIASLVWRHRKPVSIFTNPQESSSSTTLPTVKTAKPKTQEEIRVGRKIRTFKIIITLMVVFIACRLPYFAVQIMKSLDSVVADREEIWLMIFSFMALHIVNCFLNPLLYTFLNFTLKVWGKVVKFVVEVCCFCCSRGEFESFENENPFVIGEVEKKRGSKVRFENEGRY